MAHRPRRRTSEGEYQTTGIRATSDGVCASVSCNEPILKEQRIVRHRHGWIHATCASGYDDE